jgi:NADH dehydrogenase [ubiquinone] 1 alpha subcomplex assembly factor 1
MNDWRIVNDNVMGGVSDSRVTALPEGVRFEGVVRLEFNGGFASMRRPWGLPAAAVGLRVRARGDGHRYRLTAYTRDSASGRPWPFNYHATFETAVGATTVATLTWPQFRASFRGRAVPDAPPLAAADVIALGVMMTKGEHRDGAGAFALDLLDIAPVLPPDAAGGGT